jgi:exopolysaccharide biosynthesis polyprenyl glycosylphosphotransferase
VAGLLALVVRFDPQGVIPAEYFLITVVLPFLWLGSVALAGGYDPRFIGTGSEEFRKILNAAVSLTAGVAILSYAAKFDLARGYVVMALPCTAAFDITARYALRKHLHRRWRRGQRMRRTVAVGHAAPVEHLVAMLRRDSHHGLTVVAACVAGAQHQGEVADVPICGDLDSVGSVVSRFHADTVAVLACPEMDGTRLRELAWDLEKTGTEMCVASALLDVAGPRTTIRPVAGLPLLHVDHAELAGGKKVIKEVFDKVSALLALMLLAPLFVMIALTIKFSDRGPVFFRQTRTGKDGQPFRLWKFRTMVVDAEARKTELLAHNNGNGALFKMHRDPRVTRAGACLRRWSLDELPQLLNVVLGDMSLVGPRPALPAEVAEYGDHMRRRLAVKPGITGLWQVSGRSDLAWDEAERLDLRYVENWSLALDLQILWRTLSAVTRGSGAY